MKGRYFFTVFVTALLLNCSPLQVEQKPILFNEERDSLTLNYVQQRYNMDLDTPEMNPKMIVLHWTAIPTFQRSFAVFYDTKIAGWRDYVGTVSPLNVSTHYLVDRDGTVYQMMPDTKIGRHIIGLNHVAIGIENVGGTPETPLTRKQLKANIRLVKELAGRHKIDYLIGHYEYTRFEDHPLWKEVDSSYRTEKEDPGREFMAKVRKATRKLNFKPLPQGEKPPSLCCYAWRLLSRAVHRPKA